MMQTNSQDEMKEILTLTFGAPTTDQIRASRARVDEWFAQEAPLIMWDTFEAPVGQLFVAATEQGVSEVAFRLSREAFLSRLDPKARIRRDPEGMAEAIDQLKRYFSDPSIRFELPLDLTDVTPFQRRALKLIRQIPAGQVWTYKHVAEQLGKPRASRAVGQAMARNPVPIIIPCHRVVGSSGKLTGYGGGGGIATKKYLLQYEGAF